MTGYGKAVAMCKQGAFTIELRSLNSKQLDLNLRMPSLLREKENEIRSTITNQLERGKVDLTFALESNSEDGAARINARLFKSYFNQLKEMSKELTVNADSDIFTSVLRLPDIISTTQEELDDEDWKRLTEALNLVITKAGEFRVTEGKILENDLAKRVKNIVDLMDEVVPFEKNRITLLRERFEKNLEEFITAKPVGDKFDTNRFEQEIFWYLEKLDITEEKVRLKQHCSYFSETMSELASNGRKLNFIAQEMGREINTLGSKANDANIQKIVVQMKDELEKIKEQLGNVL